MSRALTTRKASRIGGTLAGCIAVASLAMTPAAAAKTFHPTRTDDPNPNGCKKKDCSLREAVIAYNALGFEQKLDSAIVLRPGARYKLTRKGAGEDDGLTGDLDVTGAAASYGAPQKPVVKTAKGKGKPATIDGNDIDRIFDGSLTLKRVVLRDGHARVVPGDDGHGGAVRAGLTMFSPTFAGLGNIVVHKSTLVSNVADGNGGALQSELDLLVKNSNLKNNTAGGRGGAVDFTQVDCAGPEGGATLTKSQLIGNRAKGPGGAVHGGGCGGVSVKRTLMAENRANGAGGALYLRSLSLSKSTLARNVSSSGGGIALPPGNNSSVGVDRSTISGNSATNGGGGGIATFAEGPELPSAPPVAGLRVQNSTITNNRADRDGGGVGVFGDATVELDFVTITRNVADVGIHGGSQGPGRGGGIFRERGGGISSEDTGQSTVSIRSTVVALNSLATRSKPVYDCFMFTTEGFVSLGHNLIGNTANCPVFDAPGDLIGGKLGLGKLANNGGPTKTIALKKGSRAIGHASSDGPGQDQRGVKRDKKPDIGAYERVKKKRKKK